jgi:hypothetical protein
LHHTRFLTSALVATIAAASACSKDNVAEPTAGAAELRFVHSSSRIGPVDVYLAGNRVIDGVTFGRSSPKVAAGAGLQHLTLRSGGAVVRQLDAMLAANQVSAVVLTDDTVEVTQQAPDTGMVVTNNRANIRLINVAGTNTSEPTLLDVLIFAPGVGIDSVPRLGLDTRTSSTGPLMYWDPGSFRFRFVPHGLTTVLTEVSFDVAAGEKRSVVLDRDASGTYRARVVIDP